MRDLEKLSCRRAILVSALVALAVRVLCLATIPLAISNDGAWYLSWGALASEGRAMGLPVFRTPGYPLLVAGVFTVFGKSAVALHAIQLALGVAAAALAAWTGGRLAGSWGVRGALAAGLLVGLDPWALALESYALSESLAAFLLVACIALALAPARVRWWHAAALGATLGALCLTKPAFQIAVPFLILAAALRDGPGRREAGRRCAVACAVFLAVSAPWLVHNARRGVVGLAGAKGNYLWMGLCLQGLLDESRPPPEPLREPFDRILRSRQRDLSAMYEFLSATNAWNNPETRDSLRAWALRSVRADPAGYASRVPAAMLWQLDSFPSRAGPADQELRWLVARAGRDGTGEGNPAPNVLAPGSPIDLAPFHGSAPRGPVALAFRAIGCVRHPGLVRLAEFAFVAWGTLIAARRREWAVLLALAGIWAYLGLHALHLLPFSRYAFPCWIAGWALVSYAPARSLGGRARQRESSARGGGAAGAWSSLADQRGSAAVVEARLELEEVEDVDGAEGREALLASC